MVESKCEAGYKQMNTTHTHTHCSNNYYCVAIDTKKVEIKELGGNCVFTNTANRSIALFKILSYTARYDVTLVIYYTSSILYCHADNKYSTLLCLLAPLSVYLKPLRIISSCAYKINILHDIRQVR